MEIMSNLLSGLFGAIIASLLSLLYLYVTEKIRRRRTIYLQVVEYLDDIYIRLQKIFSYTDKQFDQYSEAKYDILGISKEDISNAKIKVMDLSLSHGIRSKVASEYGEGDILIELIDLLHAYLKIYNKLNNATRPAWIVKDRKELYNFFEKIADQSRIKLQRKLLYKSSVRGILSESLKKIFCLFCTQKKF